MGAGALVGQLLEQVHHLGYRRAAAAAANLLYRDRSFQIDGDGDWINRQANCTFASPTPFAQRYGYVREKIMDEWLFDYRPVAGDVVFDIGAGIGEEAIIFADLAGAVYAIEAHPETFRCLQKSVRLSRRENVVPLQVALSDADGALTI